MGRSCRLASLPLLALAALGTSCATPEASAAPFSTARVTKIENKVFLGERQAERSVVRPAAENDTMQGQNFLRSENQSRAELQYPDGTIVRVGQNTVFTFDSGSRTLTLDQGSLLFHIPKNSGGGTIKTASLTAAITGTAGKVSDNIIAIVEGQVKLVPGGQVVHAGEFARRNANGTITIGRFDPEKVLEGKLVFFHGLMPGFPEPVPLVVQRDLNFPMLRDLEVQARTQNLPGSVKYYFPIEHKKKPEPPHEDDQPRTTSPSAPVTTPPILVE